MFIPCFIWICHLLDLDSSIADGAYDHVYAVEVTRQLALVIICSSMVCTVDLLAAITLKREEVLLLALFESAMLTNITEFHFVIILKV